MIKGRKLRKRVYFQRVVVHSVVSQLVLIGCILTWCHILSYHFDWSNINLVSYRWPIKGLLMQKSKLFSALVKRLHWLEPLLELVAMAACGLKATFQKTFLKWILSLRSRTKSTNNSMFWCFKLSCSGSMITHWALILYNKNSYCPLGAR